MKTLIAVLVLTLTLTAHSQVVIWKHKITGTVMGNGKTTKLSLGGYTILDLETNERVQVFTQTTPVKRFAVDFTLDEASIRTVATGKQKYLVFSRATVFQDAIDGESTEFLSIKGLIMPVTSILNGTAWIPTKMELISRNVYENGPELEDVRGILALDSKLTKAYNAAGYSIDRAIDQIAALLSSQGYAEVF